MNDLKNILIRLCHSSVPYLPYALGQTGMAKHCRPRSDAASDLGLDCLPVIQQLLKCSFSSFRTVVVGCYLRGTHTLSLEAKLTKLLCLQSTLWKVSALKGKNLLPVGANSFLLEQTLFQKGIVSRKINWK